MSIKLNTPSAICGAHAANRYMKPRYTSDIDILVISLEEVEKELVSLGAKRLNDISTETLTGSTWLLNDEELDVMATYDSWGKHAVLTSEEGYLSLPYLVLMKLIASRSKDLADISQMLGKRDKLTLDKVKSVIKKYRPEDLEDLESLILIGQFE